MARSRRPASESALQVEKSRVSSSSFRKLTCLRLVWGSSMRSGASVLMLRLAQYFKKLRSAMR